MTTIYYNITIAHTIKKLKISPNVNLMMEHFFWALLSLLNEVNLFKNNIHP